MGCGQLEQCVMAAKVWLRFVTDISSVEHGECPCVVVSKVCQRNKEIKAEVSVTVPNILIGEQDDSSGQRKGALKTEVNSHDEVWRHCHVL